MDSFLSIFIMVYFWWLKFHLSVTLDFNSKNSLNFTVPERLKTIMKPLQVRLFKMKAGLSLQILDHREATSNYKDQHLQNFTLG